MAFDPNQYIQPVDPNAPAPADLAQDQIPTTPAASPSGVAPGGAFDPDAYLNAPVAQPGGEQPGVAGGAGEAGPSAMDYAIGIPSAAWNIVKNHPLETGAAIGLWKANKIANTWMDKARMETQATNARTTAMNAQTAQKAATEARVAQRPGFGGTPPEPTGPKIINPATGQPFTQPAPGATPGAAPAPAPGTAAAAPEGENIISRSSALWEKYGRPMSQTLGRMAESPLGRAAGGALKILGSAPVQGALLATHSENLGPQVPTKGPYAYSEVGPRGPWTPAELQQYNKIYGQ